MTPLKQYCLNDFLAAQAAHSFLEVVRYGDTIERLHTRLRLVVEKPWADELIIALSNLSLANTQAYGDLLVEAVGVVEGQKPLFIRKRTPWTYPFAV